VYQDHFPEGTCAHRSQAPETIANWGTPDLGFEGSTAAHITKERIMGKRLLGILRRVVPVAGLRTAEAIGVWITHNLLHSAIAAR
jgi:hypothetical protein